MISIIENTVNRMKKSASITGIVDNGDGTYTITADPKNLNNNDYITIASTTGFNGTYKISSVTTTGFNISKTTGTAIPGSFGTWTTTVYFMIGRWSEITRELIDKSESTEYRDKKFPLICLIIPVEFDEDLKRGKVEIFPEPFDIYYFVPTQEDTNTDARYDLTYDTLSNLSSKFNDEFKKVVIDDMNVSRGWIPNPEGRAYIFTEPVDSWKDSYSGVSLIEICN